MADLSTVAEQYFSTLNPLASKIYSDVCHAKDAYENLWHTLNEKEKKEAINESLIKPDIVLKYSLLDSLDFDLTSSSIAPKNNGLMSFFGTEHGTRLIHEDGTNYRDEHSAPFIYQTKSQLDLCELSEERNSDQSELVNTVPVMSELAMSHSKVVSELKNALKCHDMLKNTSFEHKSDITKKQEEINSPTGFISKIMNNKMFRGKDDEKVRLVSPEKQGHIVASSDNYFRTNFKAVMSPNMQEKKTDKLIGPNDSGNNRVSTAKTVYVAEESRGLLASTSLDSSGTEFLSISDPDEKMLSASAETLTEDANGVPKTGYDFLDNW